MKGKEKKGKKKWRGRRWGRKGKVRKEDGEGKVEKWRE